MCRHLQHWPDFRCIILLMIAYSFVACSEQRRESIRLILPTGYRGVVKIVESKRGTNVYVSAGEYQYHIPTNGVLYAMSLEPFHHWHYTFANDLSGQSFRFNTDIRGSFTTNGNLNGNSEVCLYSLYSQKGAVFLFVGTEQERSIALKDHHLTRLPNEPTNFWQLINQ